LIVAENDLGDGRPLVTTDGGQFIDGNTKGTVTSKANDGDVTLADLGTNDGRQAITTGAKQTRR